MVEFAFVLPLFLLLLFGIWTFGIYFMDYQNLNGIARSAAREATTVENATYVDKQYEFVKQKYAQDKTVLRLLEWKPSADGKDTDDFEITYDYDTNNVVVKVNAAPTKSNFLFKVMGNLMDEQSFYQNFGVNITYTMRSEVVHDKL